VSARIGRGVAAALVLLGLVIGVPVLLLTIVGNPWPGRTRLELGDEVALAVGVLTVLVWLAWLRFVVALVAEVRVQLEERELDTVPVPGARPAALVPPPARAGAGRLAQRLVAAALVLLPVVSRSASPAFAGVPSAAAPPVATAPVAAVPLVARAAPVADAAPATSRSVTVAPGDTLIGLARTHLGDTSRWREIFDLNRDVAQPDGGRLTSPSLLRVGWRLVLPGGAPEAAPPPAPYLAAAAVTIQDGDTLWDLSRARLAAAGLPVDDDAVADHVQAVIAANADVVEDPDLIYPGERFQLPALGTPPSPAPLTQPAAPRSDPAPTAIAESPPSPTATPAASTSAATSAVSTTTSTTATPAPGARTPGTPAEAEPGPRSSPIGLGEAALLSAGVAALLAARRRVRLRASAPRARVPEPHPDVVDAERRLCAVDAGERLLRVDVAVRAAAASLVHGAAEIAVVQVGTDGGVELDLSAPASLPAPWEGDATTWHLPGSTPIELLADAARGVGAPCVALVQLGVGHDGREVLADLEVLGALAVDAAADTADAIVHGLAATLASSLFAEVAHLVAVGIDEHALLDHRHAHVVATVDGALELAATVIGATSATRQSTFVRRARHTSGEAWEPAVVFVASYVADEVTADVVRAATRPGSGLALVVAGGVTDAPWALREVADSWRLDPLGLELVPVGLPPAQVDALSAVLAAADAPLVEDEQGDGELAPDAGPIDVPWSLMVRLLGPVDVVDRAGTAAVFERSKALELVAWLTMHRERATRAGARTALWELDVRDATFANVVSEARRAMGRLVEPAPGEEWLGRTLTEVLPLHDGVVADVDAIRRRLAAARLQPPELAIETLRPAVELVRDIPFAGTGYLWPDAEGITSNVVLLATSAAAELAGHFLSIGDIDGVFWATDRGLRVLPGHEELIALRMRAHARAGDLAGVRHEWESYERVLNADPWSDGEPAAKLVTLRRELLSS
jgi:nucleoid-associated protein YgaU